MSATELRRSVVAGMLFAGLFTATSIAQAQLRDSGKKPWVVVKGSLKDFTGKSDTIVADFDSEEAAKQQAQRLNEALKGDDVFKWLFTARKRKAEDRKPSDRSKELLARLKEAKEAVDRAKKVEKGEESVFKAKERKLGDTIKEYKDMVQRSYRQVVDAKKTLTGGVTTLTDAKMREVNGLIDRYNGEVKDFQAVMGKDADLGFSPLARVQPFDPKKARAEVVGTWKGVSVQGDSRLSIDLVFNEDGTVTNRAENGRTGKGTWSREGDLIKVTWSTGVKVSWKLKDGKIGGSGTTSRGQPWSISFRKE